jgi:phenylacetate-coenzyme A ligase PaaK-like adenylate-forming protein
MQPPDPIRSFRDTLLRQTVAWCRERSPFYRERLAGLDEFDGVASLPRVPVLLRKDVVDHHEAIRCDPSLPSAVQHTTGTTGRFLQLYRSAAEQDFIWRFFAAQLDASPAAGIRPLHMSLANAYHGALIGMPSRAYVLSVGVHDRAQASQARGVLERTYDLPGVEPRVSVLTGTERMVMALTAYLLAEGVRLAESPVRTIALFGGHVPVARKRLLASLWGGVQIKDCYSLTEMFGGARECGVGGPWLFDPHVVPEVVHPRTFAPVHEGVGVLLLSSLYPFVQQMPLLRYLTGDLVEVVAGPDAPGGLQVRYVGRMPRSILDLGGELEADAVRPLLLSAPLYEELLAIPDIAITPRFADLRLGPELELTGDLHYAVQHEPAADGAPERITLRLGLRYAPWMYPERVAELVRRLVQALFRHHPHLARRCTEGSLELRVRPAPATDVPPHDSK